MITETTPEQILADLRQRITDGDETVTAAELQQAEAAVEFTRLQAEGQQARDLAAAHQACLEELATIRTTVEKDLPNVAKKLAIKLAKIDHEIEEALQIANNHDRQILNFKSRIKILKAEGATIDDLESTANGIIAGDRIVSTFNLEDTIRRAVTRKADYPSQKLTFADEFKPVDRAYTDNCVSVRVIRRVGGHEEGDLIKVLPSVAERMISQDWAEIA